MAFMPSKFREQYKRQPSTPTASQKRTTFGLMINRFPNGQFILTISLLRNTFRWGRQGWVYPEPVIYFLTCYWHIKHASIYHKVLVIACRLANLHGISFKYGYKCVFLPRLLAACLVLDQCVKNVRFGIKLVIFIWMKYLRYNVNVDKCCKIMTCNSLHILFKLRLIMNKLLN